MTKPRAIILDMGGTILRQQSYDPVYATLRLLAFAENPRNISANAIRAAAVEIQTKTFDRIDRSLMELPAKAFHRLLFDRFGITFDLSEDELAMEFWRAAMVMVPEPNVEMALKAAEESGVRLLVLSNSTFGAPCLRNELERHGLKGYFEYIMASADYGLRKPDPLLYQAALGLLGVAAKDVWMISNSLEGDLQTALTMGMHPVWYTAGPPPRGRANATRLMNWADFPGLLANSK